MSSFSPLALVARVAISAPGRRALAQLCTVQVRQLSRQGKAASAQALARRRARFLSDRGASAAAQKLLDRCARILAPVSFAHSAVLRLEFLDLAFARQGGTAWNNQYLPAIKAVCTLADAAWDRGEAAGLAQTADLLDLLARTMFNRNLHFGAVLSPLAQGRAVAQEFLQPLFQCRAWQALGAAPGSQPAEAKTMPAAGAGAPKKAAKRILVISLQNWNFIDGIIADLRGKTGVEVRTLDLAQALTPVPNRPNMIRLRLASARGEALAPLPAAVVQALQWADTIWVEWGAAQAAWVSTYAPLMAKARVVVRLHSYEASTLWPQLTNWAAVHTLVTICPAIRHLLEATVPALAPENNKSAARPEMVTCYNRALLHQYALPKLPHARRTLALVGWASLRKDPAWALEVLDLLRQSDPDWQLLLIGADFPAALGEAQDAYSQAVCARIKAFGKQVRITGATTEVADWLKQAGVILSSSRRESAHQGFIEGVASAAVPVCRNWPDTAAWGKLTDLFPAAWIVDTPQQAAARIQALTADPEVWQAAGKQAQTWILQQRDWAQVRASYEKLLFADE